MVQKYQTYNKIMCPLMIAFGSILALYGTYPIVAGVETSRWPTAPGKILSSKMSGPHETEDGREYITDVWYEYWVDGERHEGNKPGYGDMYSKNLGQAEEVLKEYPVGRRVRIHYRPDSPDESVREAGVSVDTFLTPVAGLIAVIVGVRVLRQCGPRPAPPAYQYRPKPPL